MTNAYSSPSRKVAGARRQAQRGVSLLFSLMALVILGFGAVALTRSVDTGTLIMGNLSFRQDAVSGSTTVAEEAMAWLQANQAGTKLDNDDTAKGYYSSSIESLDPTGNRTSPTNKLAIVKWDGVCQGVKDVDYTTCEVIPVVGASVNNNKVQYIITRLCDSSGPPVGTNLCVRPAVAATNNVRDRGELTGPRLTQGMGSPYYRIIVRVQGPRNTVSFTETLIHF